MIIGFCGQAGSGKSTSADFLVKNDGFVSLALADPMKRICREVYDFTDDQLYGPSTSRNAPDKRYPRVFATTMNDGPNHKLPVAWLTPRHALQQLGTEWARDCYENTWVDLALRTASALLHKSGVLRSVHYSYDVQQGLICTNVPMGPKPKGVVISDVRFLNEVKAIKAAGGYVIKLLRGEGLEGAAGQHKSETELQGIPLELFDRVIDNREWGLDQLESYLHNLVQVELSR